MQDNLARKLPQESYYETNARRREQLERQKRVQEAKAKKENTKFCMKIAAVGIVIFAFAMILMTRFAYINELEYKIGQASAEYEELASQNITKDAEIKQSVNIDEIEKVAKEKLGMVKPGKNQVVHIDVPVKDKVDLNENAKKGIDVAVTEKISSLLAYLH